MKKKTLPVIEFFSREVLRRGEDLPSRSSINSRIGQFMDPAKRHTIIARGEVSLARPRCARGSKWPELLAESAHSASGFYLLIVLVLFAPVSNFHFLDCCFFHRRLLPELFFAWPIYGFVFQLTVLSAEKQLTTSPQAARTASSPFFLPDEGRNPHKALRECGSGAWRLAALAGL